MLKKKKKTHTIEARNVQRLRVLPALSRGQSSVPRTYIATPAPRDLKPSSGLHRYPHKYILPLPQHVYMQKNKSF